MNLSTLAVIEISDSIKALHSASARFTKNARTQKQHTNNTQILFQYPQKLLFL